MLVAIVGDPWVGNERMIRMNSITRLASKIPGYDSTLPTTTILDSKFSNELMYKAMNARHFGENVVIDVECFTDIHPILKACVDVFVMTTEKAAIDCLEKIKQYLDNRLVEFTFNTGSAQPFMLHDRRTGITGSYSD